MKKILIPLVFLLITNFSFGQKETFRGFEWGTQKVNVKENETARFSVDKENILEFKSVLGNYDALLQYEFTTKDELMGAKYIIRNRFTNPQKHFDEYDFFADLLNEKYGDPVKKSVITTEENIKDNEIFTILLKEGNYSQITSWETSGISINLVLTGAREEVILTIGYSSKKFSELNQEQKKAMILKDL